VISTKSQLRILSSATIITRLAVEGMESIPPFARAFTAAMLSSGAAVGDNMMENLVAEMQNLRAATQDVS
jgi:hypothetical protein